jgi:hypothetical protein
LIGDLVSVFLRMLVHISCWASMRCTDSERR